MTPLAWAAVWLAHTALEYWLGKTKRVEANSVVDLAIQTATQILRK